jgi:hypothetical protein
MLISIPKKVDGYVPAHENLFYQFLSEIIYLYKYNNPSRYDPSDLIHISHILKKLSDFGTFGTIRSLLTLLAPCP